MEKWNSYKAFVWAIAMLLIIFSLFALIWMLTLGIGKVDFGLVLIWMGWLLFTLMMGPNLASNTKPIIERDKTQTDPQKGPLSE